MISADRMWESNLKHGVQYTRDQRQNHGLKLHKRKLTAQGIAERCGVGVNTVYRWTKELRDKAKGERDQTVIALAEEGTTQQQIADELDLPQKTVSNILLSQNPQMVEMAKDTAEEPSPEEPDPDTAEEPADEKSDIPESVSEEPESEAEPAIEADEEETGETTEVEKVGERPVEEQADEPEADEPEAEPKPEEAPAEEEPATPDSEPEPSPPEPIPDNILKTARAVMGTFAETRPDDYVARLEASPSEWMTITDDSLSNELERELLTSAAAMCLWQELMIWYQGENSSAFTDAFGKIGAVFVRGQAGQWSIVSKLRSILRRLRA